MWNGKGRPTGTEKNRKQRKESQAGVRRTMGIGRVKASVGGESGRVPEVLRGEGCRLDLALTTSVTGATGDWIWYFGG